MFWGSISMRKNLVREKKSLEKNCFLHLTHKIHYQLYLKSSTTKLLPKTSRLTIILYSKSKKYTRISNNLRNLNLTQLPNNLSSHSSRVLRKASNLSRKICNFNHRNNNNTNKGHNNFSNSNSSNNYLYRFNPQRK